MQVLGFAVDVSAAHIEGEADESGDATGDQPAAALGDLMAKIEITRSSGGGVSTGRLVVSVTSNARLAARVRLNEHH